MAARALGRGLSPDMRLKNPQVDSSSHKAEYKSYSPAVVDDVLWAISLPMSARMRSETCLGRTSTWVACDTTV